jgi:hypothetical protein
MLVVVTIKIVGRLEELGADVKAVSEVKCHSMITGSETLEDCP